MMDDIHRRVAKTRSFLQEIGGKFSIDGNALCAVHSKRPDGSKLVIMHFANTYMHGESHAERMKKIACLAFEGLSPETIVPVTITESRAYSGMFGIQFIVAAGTEMYRPFDYEREPLLRDLYAVVDHYRPAHP